MSANADRIRSAAEVEQRIFFLSVRRKAFCFDGDSEVPRSRYLAPRRAPAARPACPESDHHTIHCALFAYNSSYAFLKHADAGFPFAVESPMRTPPSRDQVHFERIRFQ
jgi:hypothetical protein